MREDDRNAMRTQGNRGVLVQCGLKFRVAAGRGICHNRHRCVAVCIEIEYAIFNGIP